MGGRSLASGRRAREPEDLPVPGEGEKTDAGSNLASREAGVGTAVPPPLSRGTPVGARGRDIPRAVGAGATVFRTCGR